MEVILTFITISGKQVVMKKKFSNEGHLNNFINYITNRYNYLFDEAFYQN